jgi:hypothetical protein
VPPTEATEARFAGPQVRDWRDGHALSLFTGGRNGLRCLLKFDEQAGELVPEFHAAASDRIE